MQVTRIRIDTKSVLAREVDGETVILDLNRQRYIAGTRSVTVLWPLLEEGATRVELLDALTERYEVERDQLARDLDEFLEDLAESGLLAEPEPRS
jgi:hypothetical protein